MTSRPLLALRPLGAFEQAFHYYQVRNPVHFCLAVTLAHPAGAVTEQTVQNAAAELGRAHPLLAARVRERLTGSGVEFVLSDRPVSVRVVAPGTTWETVAATEQIRAFAQLHGPLWRIVLIPAGDTTSTLVVTFDHRIADGAGGWRAVRDLLIALDGRPVDRQPLPPARSSYSVPCRRQRNPRPMSPGHDLRPILA